MAMDRALDANPAIKGGNGPNCTSYARPLPSSAPTTLYVRTIPRYVRKPPTGRPRCLLSSFSLASLLFELPSNLGTAMENSQPLDPLNPVRKTHFTYFLLSYDKISTQRVYSLYHNFWRLLLAYSNLSERQLVH